MIVTGGIARHDRQNHGGWAGGTGYAGENGVGHVAARHVAEARGIVARQRARVLKLRAQGRATPDHELTLQALVSTLAQMEGHVQELAEASKRFERPQRWLS